MNESIIQSYIKQIQQELKNKEIQNVQTRCSVVSREVNKAIEAVLNATNMKDACSLLRGCTVSIDVKDYTEHIEEWKGLCPSYKAKKLPESPEEYRKGAINWANGRRALILATKVFPQFITQSTQYCSEVATQLFYSDTTKSLLFAQLCKTAVISSILKSNVRLNQRSAETPLICQNSVTKYGFDSVLKQHLPAHIQVTDIAASLLTEDHENKPQNQQQEDEREESDEKRSEEPAIAMNTATQPYMNASCFSSPRKGKRGRKRTKTAEDPLSMRFSKQINQKLQSNMFAAFQKAFSDLYASLLAQYRQKYGSVEIAGIDQEFPSIVTSNNDNNDGNMDNNENTTNTSNGQVTNGGVTETPWNENEHWKLETNHNCVMNDANMDNRVAFPSQSALSQLNYLMEQIGRNLHLYSQQELFELWEKTQQFQRIIQMEIAHRSLHPNSNALTPPLTATSNSCSCSTSSSSSLTSGSSANSLSCTSCSFDPNVKSNHVPMGTLLGENDTLHSNESRYVFNQSQYNNNSNNDDNNNFNHSNGFSKMNCKNMNDDTTFSDLTRIMERNPSQTCPPFLESCLNEPSKSTQYSSNNKLPYNRKRTMTSDPFENCEAESNGIMNEDSCFLPATNRKRLRPNGYALDPLSHSAMYDNIDTDMLWLQLEKLPNHPDSDLLFS